MRATLGLMALTNVAADWMGQSFEQLRDKTLLEITLPGSHNSGNYQGGLSAELLCESDYRYDEYLASSSSRLLEASGRPVLSRMEFDRRMIPWNINHFHPIKTQLREEGIRFLHLKICNFGLPGAPRMDLAAVRFQHRGYTTRETVASTIEDLKDFLREHPREVVILGFNNLHNARGSFGPADVAALSAALQEAIGEAWLITQQQLVTEPLSALVASGRRVAVFVKDAEPGSYIIPSQLVLDENWSPVMASGDLVASKAWLLEDLRRRRKGRFYVMQANPNNAESNMYAAMNSNQLPASNLEFLRGFLEDLPALVFAAAQGDPEIQINAINSDFLNISQPYATAMQLMGLPRKLPHDMAKPLDGSWWLRITALCGLCACLGVLGGRRPCDLSL